MARRLQDETRAKRSAAVMERVPVLESGGQLLFLRITVATATRRTISVDRSSTLTEHQSASCGMASRTTRSNVAS
ncbi:MAG: hypothetical protein R3A46_16730 [Thermomicrobiales bacterium]